VLISSSIHYLSTWQLIGAAVLGLGGIKWGLAHYRGTSTWLLRYLPYDTALFMPLWAAPIFLLAVLSDLAAHISRVLGLVFAVPAMVMIPVAIVFIFWMPSRLLPAWYLEWRANGRQPAQLPGRSRLPGQQASRT
jgi:hypothetical protein